MPCWLASAPKWAPVLKQAFADKAAETGIGKIQSRVGAEFDERKYHKNIELALKNAAERSSIRFDTLKEREQFRDVLNCSRSVTETNCVARPFVVSSRSPTTPM